MPNEDKVQYTQPTDKLDVEAFLEREAGKPVEAVGTARSFVVEGNDLEGYRGVSPEYQTYASDINAPGRATEGVDAKLEERQAAAQSTDVPKGAKAADKDNEGDKGVERVEPKGAVFDIPVVTDTGNSETRATRGGTAGATSTSGGPGSDGGDGGTGKAQASGSKAKD